MQQKKLVTANNYLITDLSATKKAASRQIFALLES